MSESVCMSVSLKVYKSSLKVRQILTLSLWTTNSMTVLTIFFQTFSETFLIFFYDLNRFQFIILLILCKSRSVINIVAVEIGVSVLTIVRWKFFRFYSCAFLFSNSGSYCFQFAFSRFQRGVWQVLIFLRSWDIFVWKWNIFHEKG